MARKPLLEATGKLGPRERVWASVRRLKNFTYAELGAVTRTVDVQTLKSYVRALERAGYLARKGSNAPGQPQRFELAKDAGIEAPRVNADGKAITLGGKQQALWRSMRILRTPFTLVELAAAASTDRAVVSVECAKKFIRYLRLAGYVTIARDAEPAHAATYRLIPSKYTGPRAPVISVAAHVYDPNLGQIVWHPEVHS